ncbi:vesicular glutamate transporter 1-like [Rhipicephalus sanguineus]|uniref:vesicular glutamate transporter 1-like n=1 Tax=Rhipicephalus sanguineus TaxID=34632 RepID=UPI0020C58234|nr:vesicular glutamate transporter 1-like [Rhipicephalus sanguineus]
MFAVLTSTTLLGGRCMFEAVEFEFVTSPVIYANVTLGLAWFGLWYLLFFDDPYNNESVTEDERLRITEGNGRTLSDSQVHRVPWHQILRSTPVHLACLCVAAGMAEQRLGKYNYLMYLGGVTSFPALSSVLALAAAVVTSGVVSDLLRDKGWLTTTGTRRLTCSGGLIIHACATMLQGLKENHWIEHIAMTALGVFFVGIETSHVDLAPQHAPVLKALSATTLEVVLGGISVFVIADASSLTGHRLAHVFIPVAQVVAALLYLLYGRADCSPGTGSAAGFSLSVASRCRVESEEDRKGASLLRLAVRKSEGNERVTTEELELQQQQQQYGPAWLLSNRVASATTLVPAAHWSRVSDL